MDDVLSLEHVIVVSKLGSRASPMQICFGESRQPKNTAPKALRWQWKHEVQLAPIG